MKALIGIISPENMRNRMLSIASGQYKPEADEPKVWFASVNAIAQVLSNENILLLKLMHERKPQTVTELAELSGRRVSNLSATLKTLEGHGFVSLKKIGKKKIPTALFTEFDIRVTSELIAKPEAA
ncbi:MULTISPECIES: MarR family transcriptional regulator [unclassified Pantoea]|jgi:predicted transcriptional regulator|uniref:HVO_A0114 family putative DNA-binding protein n=1 Tax=unclassified Pantoea TaxID=2630326 RepID=UPI000D975905|nr:MULTISPECIES: MarR family transcriptional regulator [unclassified Pantoea]MBY4953909.1 MarR family transcriptional regulator [Pantoea sp. DY-17]PYG47339.1 putative transcriptional regulator [Pantoea sp. AG1095]